MSEDLKQRIEELKKNVKVLKDEAQESSCELGRVLYNIKKFENLLKEGPNSSIENNLQYAKSILPQAEKKYEVKANKLKLAKLQYDIMNGFLKRK